MSELEIPGKSRPEMNGKILKERAAAMAAVPACEEGTGEKAPFLEFELGGERYAVELPLVREVCPVEQIALVPGAPLYIKGAANVRGRILPVADPAVFFGLPPAGDGPWKMIVLKERTAELGILAGSVAGVRGVRLTDILPPPAAVRSRFLAGITAEGLLILHTGEFMAALTGVNREQSEKRSRE